MKKYILCLAAFSLLHAHEECATSQEVAKIEELIESVENAALKKGVPVEGEYQQLSDKEIVTDRFFEQEEEDLEGIL